MQHRLVLKTDGQLLLTFAHCKEARIFLKQKWIVMILTLLNFSESLKKNRNAQKHLPRHVQFAVMMKFQLKEVNDFIFRMPARPVTHWMDLWCRAHIRGLYGSEREFTDGTTAVADEEYIIESIVEPGALIVEGYDNVMVPYTHLSESELQSLVEFIRSLSDE
jgi:hypothetical protein